ncbi:MAG: 30S ribosomal protein S20 [Melioribacteraceae bacterium]|nr:30S ribosomal protein S20 [Melioribacteraceae bacterium]MCF8265098.1 30S ribosomal protein S20 [Melioribacteraceae bacterium]MCF8413217.1 30S ribosomal protein S20 [Melioribacteraceae bacterium]MCF8431184.1 30S ribosomal protein S20 [Melioribacteraceae bacterium]
MANHKSAKKRIRTNDRKRIRNREALSQIKTLVKKTLTEQDPDKAEVYLKDTVKKIDKNVSKGRLHLNNAARKKSKLTKHVNSLSA